MKKLLSLFSVLICFFIQSGNAQSYTGNLPKVGCNPPAKPGPISGPANVHISTANLYKIPTDSGATTYIWSVNSSTTATITAGQGTTSATVTMGSICNTFTLCVYAENTCGNSPDTCMVVGCITSVENVTDGALAYDITQAGGAGMFELRIFAPLIENPDIKVYNILGQQVYSYNSTTSSTGFTKNIDLSNLANGIYIFSFNSNEGAFRKKIVVNR